jgi:hypothetical protein
MSHIHKGQFNRAFKGYDHTFGHPAPGDATPEAKAPLGQGGRFAALEKKGISPALAAFIGRKKYGTKKMATLSQKGKV